MFCFLFLFSCWYCHSWWTQTNSFSILHAFYRVSSYMVPEIGLTAIPFICHELLDSGIRMALISFTSTLPGLEVHLLICHFAVSNSCLNVGALIVLRGSATSLQKLIVFLKRVKFFGSNLRWMCKAVVWKATQALVFGFCFFLLIFGIAYKIGL